MGIPVYRRTAGVSGCPSRRRWVPPGLAPQPGPDSGITRPATATN